MVPVRGPALLGLLGALFLSPGFLSSQTLQELAFQCGGAQGGGVEAWCYETVLAAQAARGGLGLAGSLGSPMPGTASTLGRRLRSFPRISLGLRGGVSRLTLPGLFHGGDRPRGENTFYVPTAHLSASVGVLNGFFLAPTVGGVFSVDLLGSASLVSAPGGEGFRDGVTGLGGGVRVGLLRESFTLPGISVSAMYRSLGRTGLGRVEEGDPSQARFDVDVTSLRASVGKDLLGLGLLAGMGWERYGGDMAVLVRDPVSGDQGGATASDLTSDRVLFFLGGSMTYLILQLSGEVGWAQGFEPDLPGRPGGDFDPDTRSLFGSLALRITF